MVSEKKASHSTLARPCRLVVVESLRILVHARGHLLNHLLQIEIDVAEAEPTEFALVHLFVPRLRLDLLASQHLHEVVGALHVALVLHEFDAFFLHVLEPYDVVVVYFIKYLALNLVLAELTRREPEALPLQLRCQHANNLEAGFCCKFVKDEELDIGLVVVVLAILVFFV